jgi:hypothetical protein
VVWKWTDSLTMDCPDVCLEAFWLQEWERVLEDCHKRSCWKNSIGVAVPINESLLSKYMDLKNGNNFWPFSSPSLGSLRILRGRGYIEDEVMLQKWFCYSNCKKNIWRYSCSYSRYFGTLMAAVELQAKHLPNYRRSLCNITHPKYKIYTFIC